MEERRKVWLMKRILADAKTYTPQENKSLHQLPCAWKEHPGKLATVNLNLGGGFKHLLFSPLFGEDFQFD